MLLIILKQAQGQVNVVNENRLSVVQVYKELKIFDLN